MKACGTKPAPSPWRLDEQLPDGRIVLARTEWFEGRCAFHPSTTRRTFANEAEAAAFIRACSWWPLHRRRTTSGIASVDCDITESFDALSREARTFAHDGGRMTAHERRLLAVRELHKWLDRIAARRGLPTGGW